MKIILSKPLALNQLYAINKWGGKYLTAKGRAWKEEALWSMRLAKKENWDVPVSLEVVLYTCRHQDNDGILKVLQDTLQEAGVIADDYWIFHLVVDKVKCKAKEEKIIINVEKL